MSVLVLLCRDLLGENRLENQSLLVLDKLPVESRDPVDPMKSAGADPGGRSNGPADDKDEFGVSGTILKTKSLGLLGLARVSLGMLVWDSLISVLSVIWK